MPKYVPDAMVAKRYGVTLRTVNRWEENPALEFPPALYINNRKYRDAEALDEWDASRVTGKPKVSAERMHPAAPAEGEVSSNVEAA